MRIGGILILFILITSGTAFAKSYCLVWEFPCRSEIVVLERRYCPPCPDRIACIKEDTLITEAKAALLACKIARCKIYFHCPCCSYLTTWCPVKTRCLSVVKKVEIDPCFEARVNRSLDRLNDEIELLKSRVRSLEIRVF